MGERKERKQERERKKEGGERRKERNNFTSIINKFIWISHDSFILCMCLCVHMSQLQVDIRHLHQSLPLLF